MIQNAYPSPVTFAPTMTVATPLLSTGGERLGVFAPHVSLSNLDCIVKDRTGLGDSGESYLVDKYNVFVSAASYGTEEFPRGVHSFGIDAAVEGERGAQIYRRNTTMSLLIRIVGP